jgi:hypothetical protein
MFKQIILAAAALVLALSAASSLPVLAAEKNVQVMLRQLEKKGATVVPMTKMPQAFTAKPKFERYSCDSVACWCSGSSDCFNMISNEGLNCTHLVCGNDHGTPVCWCDL